jgi:hypothetical protein
MPILFLAGRLYFFQNAYHLFHTGPSANEANDCLADTRHNTIITLTKIHPCDPAVTTLTQISTDAVVVNRTAQRNTEAVAVSQTAQRSTEAVVGSQAAQRSTEAVVVSQTAQRTTTDSDNGKLWSTTGSHNGT